MLSESAYECGGVGHHADIFHWRQPTGHGRLNDMWVKAPMGQMVGCLYCVKGFIAALGMEAYCCCVAGDGLHALSVVKLQESEQYGDVRSMWGHSPLYHTCLYILFLCRMCLNTWLVRVWWA